MFKNELGRRNLYLLIVLISISFFIFYRNIIAVLFKEVFANLVYGFILLFIFAGLLWLRRNRLRRAKYRQDILLALIVFLLGIGLLLLSEFRQLAEFQYPAFLLSLTGLVLLVMGRELLRAFLLPVVYIICIYLIFHFEFLDRLPDIIHLNFQIITAFFSFLILRIGGVVVFQNWTYLMFPHVSLIVDHSCSGLNHIVALFLLAIPLAETGRKTRSQKGLLFLFGVFLAIFLNGLRIALIGIWSYAFPQLPLHGPQNILYVPFVFVLGSFLMIVVSGWMDKVKTRLRDKG